VAFFLGPQPSSRLNSRYHAGNELALCSFSRAQHSTVLQRTAAMAWHGMAWHGTQCKAAQCNLAASSFQRPLSSCFTHGVTIVRYSSTHTRMHAVVDANQLAWASRQHGAGVSRTSLSNGALRPWTLPCTKHQPSSLETELAGHHPPPACSCWQQPLETAAAAKGTGNSSSQSLPCCCLLVHKEY
jgi:hypothetical protein